jgi:hypothetical protein
MVFGFTTACAISAYHHRSCEFESHSGVLYATLCDNVCQWLAAGCWFSPGTPVSFTNKTDRHDITEIFLKVVVNTISLSLTLFLWICEGRNLLFSLLSLTQISCLFIHLWLLYGQTQEHDWSHHLQCLSVTIMNLLTVTEYPCHKLPRIYFICRYYNPSISSFTTYHHRVCNTTGATCGAETVYPYGTSDSPPVLIGFDL